MTRLTGKVVCVGCTVEEVHKASPDQHDLYLLSHRRGQVVIEVERASEPQLWRALTVSPQLWVRASDELFTELTAEQNLFKEVEISGLLRNTRTLDMVSVSITG
jgi:hypothetical protein